MIVLKIITALIKVNIEIKLTYISLIASLPIIIFSRERLKVLVKIDWATLIFFASMFVLMNCVWDIGFFQQFLNNSKIISLPAIFGVSVFLSQLISNVPLVALFLPILKHAASGLKEIMALSAASTIAGNMFILGAASNIIIIQNAEKKKHTLTFFEFAKVGIPVTIVNVIIYMIFLQYIN